MTISDAIKKLRVMLNADEPVQEVKNETEVTETEVKMEATATLVDGTIVVTETELVPGAILYIEVEEGDRPFAPEGQHETTEGLIVTVGENGEIVSIEEKEETAEPVAEEASEEKKEEEMVSQSFDAEELLEGIASIIKPFQSEIEGLKNELNVLQERFNEVADAPAAQPVKKNFMEDARAQAQIADARLAKLAQMRKK
jgi:uncharacterized protein YuzE